MGAKRHGLDIEAKRLGGKRLGGKRLGAKRLVTDHREVYGTPHLVKKTQSSKSFFLPLSKFALPGIMFKGANHVIHMW